MWRLLRIVYQISCLLEGQLLLDFRFQFERVSLDLLKLDLTLQRFGKSKAGI